MSCYQVLSLDNNKGDLSITQGNTVNLAQVIQNFSIKTPVVDFKIDGQVISLYYRDATGALQLKTITLPPAGNNNSAISVASTTSITASIASGVITSSVNISHATGNTLTLNPDGLFAPPATLAVAVENSASISLVNNAGLLQGSLIVSHQAGNALSIVNDGVFVAPTTMSASQVRNLFSATSPIIFDATTGIISETLATTSTPGYLSAADWNTFNNKLNAVQTVGSSSSTAVYKATITGTAQVRSLAAGTGIGINLLGDDIIISTTATVPIVNAGAPQTITTPTSLVTMNGSAIVTVGSIAAVEWSLIAGPNVPVITDTSLLSTTVTGLIAGVYRFRLNAMSTTGLIGTNAVVITVSSGSITLDTIYVGAQVSGTPPNAAAVLATGVTSMQNGANDVAADWTSLTASTPLFTWFAIPNLGGTYFKTKWFVDSLNHGNIGGGTDTFGSYTIETISGISYNVCISNFATQWVGIVQLQA